MYNPIKFKSEDQGEAFALMDKYPFATLINVINGQTHISHLPLTPKRVGHEIELIGHMARANPHWTSFLNSQATVIFHGPHTYITPKWYADGGVPTWNYMTVHAIGTVELIEDYQGLVMCLQELTTHVERHWPSGWNFEIPDNLSGNILPKNIVGFRIKVEQINFKKKLSQNRTLADQAGVREGLESRSDDNSREVLEQMKDALVDR